jgi:nicotinate dehydrogenase subunit A
MSTITLRVNGEARRVDVETDTPLLYVLRDQLALDGPKFGCGLGQCGACTVVVDGTAIRSCVTPASTIGTRAITTVEGLGTEERPGVLQRAFVAEQAAQCGYCIPGMMMTASALLAKTPQPSDAEIRTAMDGNLCRCGTHLRIMRAIKRAAGESA